MRLAQLLRLAALGLAVLCLLDPPVIVAPPPPLDVNVVIVQSPRDRRPVADGSPTTVADEAQRTVRGLRDALGAAGALRVHTVQGGDTVPCDATGPCVVITEGAAVDVADDRSGPVSVILLGGRLSPNLELRRAEAPAAHAAGQAIATVVAAGYGVAARDVQVRLYDGDVVVGETMHKWTGDGEEAIEVPWWPIASGRRTLTARISTTGDEGTDTDNALVVAADVSVERWPILVLERRASWSGTFVRRALEEDPRFEVSAITDLAPGVSVAPPGPRGLDPARLDPFRVVVAGAPDALSDADVSRLERFVTDRGGALLLLPDRPLSGAVTRLVPHRWRERLAAEPTAAGPLQGSEWLVRQDVRPLDEVWAESEAGPVVVATPLGNGVVVVSGALDAWRRRSDSGFDAYWQATVARLAIGVGDPVSLRIGEATRAPGGEVEVRLRARTSGRIDRWQAHARRVCDEGPPAVLRLWPDDAPGSFVGRVPMGDRTGCRVEAGVEGVGRAVALLPDRQTARETFRWTTEQAEAFAAGRGGLVVRPDGLEPLVASWLAARPTERRPEPRYPMRSWWWLLPFVTALAAEWWLRRRVGLR